MWRKLGFAIDSLVESNNFAEEYVARRRIEKIIDDLKNRNLVNVPLFESLLQRR